MLMAVNTIFEMAATLICVNYLFEKGIILASMMRFLW